MASDSRALETGGQTQPSFNGDSANSIQIWIIPPGFIQRRAQPEAAVVQTEKDRAYIVYSTSQL